MHGFDVLEKSNSTKHVCIRALRYFSLYVQKKKQFVIFERELNQYINVEVKISILCAFFSNLISHF